MVVSSTWRRARGAVQCSGRRELVSCACACVCTCSRRLSCDQPTDQRDMRAAGRAAAPCSLAERASPNRMLLGAGGLLPPPFFRRPSPCHPTALQPHCCSTHAPLASRAPDRRTLTLAHTPPRLQAPPPDMAAAAAAAVVTTCVARPHRGAPQQQRESGAGTRPSRQVSTQALSFPASPSGQMCMTYSVAGRSAVQTADGVWACPWPKAAQPSSPEQPQGQGISIWAWLTSPQQQVRRRWCWLALAAPPPAGWGPLARRVADSASLGFRPSLNCCTLGHRLLPPARPSSFSAARVVLRAAARGGALGALHRRPRGGRGAADGPGPLVALPGPLMPAAPRQRPPRAPAPTSLVCSSQLLPPGGPRACCRRSARSSRAPPHAIPCRHGARGSRRRAPAPSPCDTTSLP